MNNRIRYIDGLRGVAILMVMTYHAYSRWSNIVPYGNTYADIYVFKYGYLGVQLFFIISGFVILMTLEKCLSFKEFIYRRWLRLFPAMLVCSIFIFLTSAYFHERPRGQPLLSSLLPGLTFVEPYLWSKIVGISVKDLEGVFWSLYVEVKFYIFAAIIYFRWGRNFLVGALIFVFSIATFFKVIHGYTGGYSLISVFIGIIELCSFKYFGWFASGAAFYMYSETKDMKWFCGALCVAFFSSATVDYFKCETFLLTSLIPTFFAFSMVNQHIENILKIKFLQFFGFISYPLYLIHENIMISIIIKFGNCNMSIIPTFLFPVISIMIVSFFAYFISKYFEKSVKFAITKSLNLFFN